MSMIAFNWAEFAVGYTVGTLSLLLLAAIAQLRNP